MTGPSSALTLGGATVGLSVLLWTLIRWWRGGKRTKGEDGASGKARDPKALAPFGAGAGLGILASACTGGLLATIAAWTAAASNRIGDTALSKGTGSATPAVTRAHLAALTPGGAVVIVLLAVGVVCVWKSTGKPMKRQMAGGGVCGVTLGLSAGAVGIVGATLVPLANSVGGGLVGLL